MSYKLNSAILSGFCAATASACGKLSGLPTFQGFFLARVFFFVLMLLFNAGVWNLFVKALHSSESSLIATVTSATSNYILSAIFGFFIFKEVTSLLWWSGMFLIISGLLLILKDQDQNQGEKTQIKQQ